MKELTTHPSVEKIFKKKFGEDTEIINEDNFIDFFKQDRDITYSKE